MNKKGFTLIELLAVIVVLALILAIAIPAITGIITETKKKAMIADAKLIIKALNLRKLESTSFDITSIDQTNIESNLSINDENYGVLVIKYKNEKPYITIEGTNKWDGLTVYGYFDDMQVIGSSDYDVVPPTLSIIGLSELTIEQGGIYYELGVLAEDNQDTNIQSKVLTTGTVDTSKLGTYTIKYNAEDLTGNTAVEKVRTIHVVAPANPEIVFSPTTNTTYEKTQSTTVSVTDNVAVNTASLKYLWSTNTTGIVEGDFTSTFTNNTAVTTPTNLTGNYYIWVLAKDLAGNTTISRSDIFKLDNTEPTGVAAIVGDITSNSFKVTANGEDLDSGIKEYQFSVDNGTTWTTSQTSNVYDYSNLKTGTYGVRVRVIDNVGFAVESNTQNISTTEINEPSYSINVVGWSQSKTITIDYHTTLYTKQYSLDSGSTWTTVTTQTKELTFTENGSVIAKISDGTNTITASTYNITQLDSVAPEIGFNPNGNMAYSKSHSTTVSVTDNASLDTTSLKYLWSTSASGIEESDFSTSFTNGGLLTKSGVTGGYYLWIFAKDSAGNVSIIRSSVFNIDNNQPLLTIVGSSSLGIPNGSIYLEEGATAIDPEVGDITTSVTNSSNINTAVNGTYSVVYSVQDAAGNTSTKTRTVTVIAPIYNYSYTGGQQTFVVPETGKYRVETWGAQGGTYTSYIGGKGGYSKGEITLTKGTTLYLHVGGAPTTNEAGGYNGGGTLSTGQGAYGRSGGGASDVRLNSGVWNDTTGLRSRIIVAGGGGGANNRNAGDTACGYGAGRGGAGGNLTGESGETTAHTYNGCTYGWGQGGGGTQTTGGKDFQYNSFGTLTSQAINGSFGYANGSQSGGGGGYYGGGSTGHGGGGGGSSFISGYPGANAINSSGVHTGQANHYSGYVFNNYQMIDGNNTMPAPAGGTETGHSGNGYIKITFLPPNVTEFKYTGGSQVFAAEKTGKYRIELWGAEGGTYSPYAGGKGAYTKGEVQLTAGTNLYVFIGGVPTSNEAGGYNGGGTLLGGQGIYGRAGGGATDIRLSSGAWNDTTGLRSRIMVAGGGAGANYRNAGDTNCGYGAGKGGSGGNLIGETGETTAHTYNGCTYGWGQGSGGTQTEGGRHLDYNSSGVLIGSIVTGGFGYGGGYQSAGGGGYYGGGYAGHGGAGGGSSFISGYPGSNAVNSSGTHTGQANHYSGYVFVNGQMISGSNVMSSPTGGTEIGHLGNGYARITYIGQ